jgi:hypothetical protein
VFFFCSTLMISSMNPASQVEDNFRTYWLKVDAVSAQFRNDGVHARMAM